MILQLLTGNLSDNNNNLSLHNIKNLESNNIFSFREYRRAYEKLRHKELSRTVSSDKPPQMGTLFCRKLFRDLRI